ncbi:Lrp/AsnC family transcriptional regulator [Rhodobacteraceae bacterium RKSG542]|uniref:Lrp/AsnC family transcriptional regulator n=1 Tax=Pseudovibrio flavus TaxID=2529854 RepID=UPI0035292661|nr:Lrp/AsnC family transcriptional regulator [Pseudovibrio flavus]
MDLDSKDREIIGILAKDARISIKALAAKIDLSRSATSERLSKLERSGVIRGYRADIASQDPALISAFLLIRLERTPMHSLLDTLAAFPAVKRVSSVSGELDLIVEVEAQTMEALNTVRDRIAVSGGVCDLTTSIILRDEIQRA